MAMRVESEDVCAELEQLFREFSFTSDDRRLRHNAGV
jgi:hypothetical protein